MKIVENAEPKKKKNFNRNRKKNWRHKIDLNDIECSLSNKRREEMHGGALGERPFDDLFILDSNDKAGQTPKKVISLAKKGSKSLPPGKSSGNLKARNKQPTNQGLKCQKFLSGLPGVKPISKGGNKRKQRVPKILASTKIAIKNKNKSKILLNTLKNRREKDFARKKLLKTSKVFAKDLWQSNEESKHLEQKYGKWARSYLEHAVQYYKVKRGLNEIRAPKFRFLKPSLQPVNAPDPGLSYNPSLRDHMKLIKMARREDRQLKAQVFKHNQLRNEYIRYALEAPSEKEEMSEILSGLPVNIMGKTAGPKEPSDEEDEVATCTARPSLKRRLTKKQKLKILKEKMTRRLERKKAARKKMQDDLNNLDNLVKEIEMKKLKSNLKRIRNKDVKKKKKEQFRTKRLGPHKFKKESVHVSTLKHLTGNVRTIKPIGSHIASNIKSKQQRNMIAPEKSKKPVKRLRKIVPLRGKAQEIRNFVEELNVKI